ncbi:MAG: D-alanyl-D-alanine carboxypeptidase/D-alanyl-D-alanine-endopeptidase [Vulcanimicrobiaceae bacterium]
MRGARACALAACVAALCGASPAAIVVPAPGGAAWSGGETAALGADLDGLLGGAALRGAHVGVLAVATGSGAVLYARAADDAFQPASTLKLLVGSAALDRLGPQYRFRTSLVARADAAPARARLILRAGGDPLLGKAELDEAIRAASAAATPAAAELSIDDARYDRQPYPAGWTWDDFPYAYAPRISAVTFEENVVHVSVSPGTRVGAPAVLSTLPFNALRAGRAGCGATADVVVRPHVETAAADSDPDALDVVRAPGGCIDIVGTIPLGSAPQTVDAAVPSPALYAYAYLRGGLAASLGAAPSPGASFPDEHRYDVRDRALPAHETVLWQHDSPPLAAFLGQRFWIPSDNLVGEVLLKELGYVTGAAPGTTVKGAAYEKVWLRNIGVDPATVTLADGCGMSQYDRITPRDLVAILQHDWNGPHRQLVLDALPVGGARGTIEGVADTAAAGRVFAKSGSM